MTAGAGSEVVPHQRLQILDPQVQGLGGGVGAGGGHTRYCGSMIPGAEYGKGHQTGDCGHVTQVQGPKMVSAWRLWMCEPGTGSGKGHQAGDCGCVSQVQGLGKCVSLKTVDMWT